MSSFSMSLWRVTQAAFLSSYNSGTVSLVTPLLPQRQAVETVMICEDDCGECPLHIPCVFAHGVSLFVLT